MGRGMADRGEEVADNQGGDRETEAPLPVPNLDRRMVLAAKQPEVDDDEDEYNFEEDEEASLAPSKWRAVARYYSGQNFKTWVLFNELSKAWGKQLPVPARELGDNRFLVEFDSEWLWNKAFHGGPWKYNGDAVIFVAI